VSDLIAAATETEKSWSNFYFGCLT